MQSIKQKLKLDWCSHEAAKYACENWHYSKRIPVNKLIKVGVWEDSQFKGVIIFGLGASATLHKQFGVKQNEVCELVRVALNSHKNPVTRMLKIAVKNFLIKRCPGLKVLVSFADMNEGHHGGIYQGGNWIYTGVSAKVTEYFYNNKWRHATDVYKRLDPKFINKLKTRRKDGKHRYIYIIDKSLKDDILKRSIDYPKRIEHESNASGFQSEEGGAVPTNTHQKTLKA